MARDRIFQSCKVWSDIAADAVGAFGGLHSMTVKMILMA